MSCAKRGPEAVHFKTEASVLLRAGSLYLHVNDLHVHVSTCTSACMYIVCMSDPHTNICIHTCTCVYVAQKQQSVDVYFSVKIACMSCVTIIILYRR